MDHISILSDSILCHIISFLPLKSAVRSSVLAKRWINLWTSSLLNLEFDWEEIARNKKKEEFVSLVNKILDLHDRPKICGFRLCGFPPDSVLGQAADRFVIEKWLNFAYEKRVEDLELNFSIPIRLDVNNPLINIYARSSYDLRSLSFKGLNSLRKLSLACTRLPEDLIQTVLCECPLLESLSICECRRLGYLTISAPNLRLKSLKVLGCWLLDAIEIYAPNLVYFEFQAGPGITRPPKFYFKNVALLVDAKFYFVDYSSAFLFTCDADEMFFPLDDLSDLMTLTVCGNFIKVIYGMDCRKSYDMKELRLHQGYRSNINLSILDSFLAKFPRIEKLSIDLNLIEYKHSLFKSEARDFELDHVKTIKLEHFAGTVNETELELVSLLLEKAVVLETMYLIPPPADQARSEVSEEELKEIDPQFMVYEQLLSLPRASSQAKIVIVSK